MQVLVHGAVLEGVNGGAVVRGVGGSEVLEERGEADADFEGVHSGFFDRRCDSCKDVVTVWIDSCIAMED